MPRGAIPILLLVTLTGILFSQACMGYESPLPSDEFITQQWSNHRDAFEKILQMAREDTVMTRIANDFTIPEINAAGAFDQERWSAYQELFKRARVKEGIFKESRDVHFIFAVQGMYKAGTEKGIAYSDDEKSSGTLRQTLNLQPADVAPNLPCYKKLANHWYIYYQVTTD